MRGIPERWEVPAIVDVLSGDASPSGHLPITFPRTVGQIPIYYAQLNTGRPAPAGLSGIPTGTPLDPQGYTSKYLDVEITPEYPFGFGLSYTTFDYSPTRVSSQHVRPRREPHDIGRCSEHGLDCRHCGSASCMSAIWSRVWRARFVS